MNTTPIIEEMVFPITDFSLVKNRLWEIGGRNGWRGTTWLWKIRGMLDRLLGGIGYRKGEKTLGELQEGEALDFWRVKGKQAQPFSCTLEAEMKLPGKVLLEWKVEENCMIQTIRFYPAGIWGKVYWHAVQPAHRLIFWHLGQRITQGK